MRRSISIKRTHGLGNVIMLLPALIFLVEEGWDVEVVTQARWTAVFNELFPDIEFTSVARRHSIDLDEKTLNLRLSTTSKNVEFAQLLGIDNFQPRDIVVKIPPNWSKPYEEATSGVGFAPEAGHRGRQWPQAYIEELACKLMGSPLVIIGGDIEPSLTSDFDFRGDPLEGLFGSISRLRSLVSMDSGTLHVARLLDIPTVAVFGGVNPKFITNPGDRVIVLQTGLSCFPCNKNETCNGSHDCIRTIYPDDVLEALKRVESVSHRDIVTMRADSIPASFEAADQGLNH